MKQQLESLLAHLIRMKKASAFTGLCAGVIAIRGDSELQRYITSNRPSKELHSQFFDEEHEKEETIGFWWPRKDSMKRINYLKALIAY